MINQESKKQNTNIIDNPSQIRGLRCWIHQSSFSLFFYSINQPGGKSIELKLTQSWILAFEFSRVYGAIYELMKEAGCAPAID